MQEQLKKLGNSVSKAVSTLGFTNKGKMMTHRQGLDVVAKTGGMKTWQAVAALKQQAKPVAEEVITCDEPGGTDFTLKTGVTSCWLTVDGFAVHIIRNGFGEGIIVDISANRSYDLDPIASTYAFHADAEANVCESRGVDIDAVAEWVGLHYKVNFDAESGPKRYEWILRYIDSHHDAEGVTHFSDDHEPSVQSDVEFQHTEILQHDIQWFLRDNGPNAVPTELDDCSIEHIEKMTKEGYIQGELCVFGNDGDTKYLGWWSINRA